MVNFYVYFITIFKIKKKLLSGEKRNIVHIRFSPLGRDQSPRLFHIQFHFILVVSQCPGKTPELGLLQGVYIQDVNITISKKEVLSQGTKAWQLLILSQCQRSIFMKLIHIQGVLLFQLLSVIICTNLLDLCEVFCTSEIEGNHL